MAKFKPLNNRLFQIEEDESKSWVAYLLPKDKDIPQEISIEESLLTKFGGHYIFAPNQPSTADIQNFIDEIDKWVSDNFGNSRACMWLANTYPVKIGDKGQYAFQFGEGGLGNYLLYDDINIPIGDQISLTIHGSTWIEATDRGLAFTSKPIVFTTEPITVGPEIEVLPDNYWALLPFNGNFSGCFILSGNIPPDTFDFFRTGVAYSFRNENQSLITNHYPLIDYKITDPVKFVGSIDPINPTNANISPESINKGELRSLLVPVDVAGNAQNIKCLLSSSYGNKFTITSIAELDKNYETSPMAGAFVFENYSKDNPHVYLSPAGKFKIVQQEGAQGKPQNNNILCGLSGTESIAFADSNNTILQFLIKKPAYAPVFPLSESSPVGPPISDGTLLTPDSLTSWMNISCDQGTPHYLSQPEGGNLYGTGTSKDLLIHKDVGLSLPCDQNFSFPMSTYSYGITNNEAHIDFNKIQLFEQHIIAPVRRQEIARANPQYSPSSNTSFTGTNNPSDDATFNTTTPAGLIVTVGADTGKWKSVLLCQDTGSAQMRFNNPDEKLQQALQTNQLFLVTSTNNHLTNFENLISIENWKFKMGVGTGNQYGNYKNIMLLKFCQGSLCELVKKALGWTLAGDFNNPDEIVVISQWLQDYINAGIEQSTNGNKLFDKFKAIVTNENWNGILFLKTDILSIPPQLRGMTAGMDTDNFYAHHFGIEISPINGANIELSGPSSMFGLINYVDPGFDEKSNNPVPPTPEEDYDFKVLMLKVLFENTAIKFFESKAQLTLNRIFGLPVDHMNDSNNPYNTIILNGSIQHRKDNAGNAQTIYMLDTASDCIFYFDEPDSNTGPALKRVEIVKAQFNTLSSGDEENDTKEILSRFDLWGFMDFGVLSGEVDTADKTKTDFKVYDYFSFGNNYTVDYSAKTVKLNTSPRSGLRFSGLGINMDYPKDKPSERSFSFDSSSIAFDLKQSTIRATKENPVASLYDNLNLEIEGIISGDEKNTPADMGFLQIGTELRLTGVTGKWTGIQFKISMGTIGELAGKVKLASHLLLAWDTNNVQNPAGIFVGIKLPGSDGNAKLFSLQGVLKLSVRDILLNYIDSQNSYLLTLTDIALKFLGMLKLPPNGSTSFYLFGNPKPDGKSNDLGWYTVYNQDKKQ